MTMFAFAWIWLALVTYYTTIRPLVIIEITAIFVFDHYKFCVIINVLKWHLILSGY